MTAVTLLPVTGPGWGGVGSVWLQHVLPVKAVVVLLFCWCSLQRWFVVWEPHSGRKQSCFFLPAPWVQTLLNPFAGWVCGVSYRPISTGQLHESLVLASTSGLSTQWSGWGPLTHKVYGNLILKRASRLDAFSGYPIRT
jgi:hypothetical protein